MKKAKLILTAISVFAVVGGALAFKAKTPNNFLYALDEQGICNRIAEVDPTLVGNVALNATIIANAGATTSPAICTQIVTYTFE